MIVDRRSVGGVIELHAKIPLIEFKEMLCRHKEEALLLVNTEDKHTREVARQILDGDTKNPADALVEQYLIEKRRRF